MPFYVIFVPELHVTVNCLNVPSQYNEDSQPITERLSMLLAQVVGATQIWRFQISLSVHMGHEERR